MDTNETIDVKGHLDPMSPSQNIRELALSGRDFEEAVAWLRRDIERVEMDKTLKAVTKTKKINELRSAVAYVERKMKEEASRALAERRGY